MPVRSDFTWSLNPHRVTLDDLVRVCGDQLPVGAILQACEAQCAVGALRAIGYDTFAMTETTSTETTVADLPAPDPETQALTYAMFHGTMDTDLYGVYVGITPNGGGIMLPDELVRLYQSHDAAYEFAIRYLGYLHAQGYTRSWSVPDVQRPPSSLDEWVCEGRAGRAEVRIELTATFR